MAQDIKVVVMEVGKPAEVRNIPNDLKSFQNIVGGMLEAVTLGKAAVLWVNEEGLIYDLPFNRPILTPNGRMDIVGNAFISGGVDDDGNVKSLSDDQARVLKDMLDLKI